MKKVDCQVVTLLFLLVAFVSIYGVSTATIPTGNLFVNPTFTGAEDVIPPPGWTVYRNLNSLDEHRRISVIDSADPERRALLIEDMVSVSGAAGDIGLQQTIDAGPGNYRAEMKVRGISGASGKVYFQIRFLPSGERESMPIQTELLSSTAFESFAVGGIAPEGTTQVRVYVFTHQTEEPSIAVQSISLVKMD